MRHSKSNKKDAVPKRKEQLEQKMHHGKPQKNKVKYNHKYHWLEEEEEEIINIKKKKKPKG